MEPPDPIVLHKSPFTSTRSTTATPSPTSGAGEAPPSRLDDLHRWPPASGQSAVHDPDVANAHLYHRAQWLHFVTGADFTHQFLTSFAYSTDEFQFGTCRSRRTGSRIRSS